MIQTATITKALKRAPKKGLTAEQIAEKTNLKLNSVRPALWQLKKDGVVEVVGTLPATFGRPANLYKLSA